MKTFVDTSALYALLDRDDAHHVRARKSFADLLGSDRILVTTNYIVVETVALLRSRLGVQAVRAFHEDIPPVVHLEWVGKAVHRSGMSALLSAARRRISLVDCVSFEVMRAFGIRSVFAFDPHFAEQGFSCIP